MRMLLLSLILIFSSAGASARAEKPEAPPAGNFVSFTASPLDLFQFQAQSITAMPEAPAGALSVYLGKTAHNVLLRQGLLKKLGYPVPSMRHFPKLEVHFADRAQKNVFIDRMEQKTAAATDRWVTDESKNSVVLQDVVIGTVVPGPDLVAGSLHRDQIQGKSELAVLLVPYALASSPESLNLFSWVGGSIYNDDVKIDYPGSDEYETKTADIQTILQKIAALTREDWEEIAQAAGLPDEVEQILVEKLISRRNSFLDLYEMKEAALPFKSQPSQLPEQEWPGYASHFSMGSPESPLNPGEIFAFTKSSAFNSLLSTAMSAINSLPVFQSQGQKMLDARLANLDGAGGKNSSSMGIWAFPFASGELIFSRDIVGGNFMGTEKLFQLSDQFGIRINLGAEISTDQLPAPVAVALKGGVSISRIYSHLKPLRSIRKVGRYPFRNIAVTSFMKSSARRLNPLFDDQFQTLRFEEKQRIYRDVLEDFRNQIEPGDSLIITDSLVGNGKAAVTANFYRLIDVTAAGELSKLILRRIHIYRKNQETFQVYQDSGEATQPSFSIEVGIRKPKDRLLQSATFPILRARWGKNRGYSTIRFYPLKFTADVRLESELDASVKQLKIIQETLLHPNTEVLAQHIKPYVIENHFREKNDQERFLLFTHRGLKSVSKISVTDPQGNRHNYLRDFFGKTNAFDFQSAANNVVDFVSQMFSKRRVNYSEDLPTNPGYRAKGRARNHTLAFEAEQLDDGTLQDRYVKISHSFNGWKLSKEKVQKKLDQLAKDYGSDLFPVTTLNETEEMFLYTVSLDISLYEKAIDHLSSLSEAQVREIFARHGVSLKNRRVDDRIVDLLQKFKNTHSSKVLLRALSIADRHLAAAGFIEFLGGKENIFILAKLNGFRKGDANGNSPIFSNTIGLAGSSHIEGALTSMREKIGMTEGEFLSLWLLGRIL